MRARPPVDVGERATRVAVTARIRGDGHASKRPVVCPTSMLGFATAFKGSTAARVAQVRELSGLG
jgi:hypothetical protein